MSSLIPSSILVGFQQVYNFSSVIIIFSKTLPNTSRSVTGLQFWSYIYTFPLFTFSYVQIQILDIRQEYLLFLTCLILQNLYSKQLLVFLDVLLVLLTCCVLWLLTWPSTSRPLWVTYTCWPVTRLTPGGRQDRNPGPRMLASQWSVTWIATISNNTTTLSSLRFIGYQYTPCLVNFEESQFIDVLVLGKYFCSIYGPFLTGLI